MYQFFGRRTKSSGKEAGLVPPHTKMKAFRSYQWDPTVVALPTDYPKGSATSKK